MNSCVKIILSILAGTGLISGGLFARMILDSQPNTTISMPRPSTATTAPVKCNETMCPAPVKCPTPPPLNNTLLHPACEPCLFEIMQHKAPTNCSTFIKYLSSEVCIRKCIDNSYFVGRYNAGHDLIGTHVPDINEVCTGMPSDRGESRCAALNDNVLKCPDGTHVVNDSLFLTEREFNNLCNILQE